MKTFFEVDHYGTGQRRPYGPHVDEYLVTVRIQYWGPDEKGVMHIMPEPKPYVRHVRTDTPENALKDEAERRAWAIQLCRALCGHFRVRGDQDGLEGTQNGYYARTLHSLWIEPQDGTIRLVLHTPYTD